MVRFMATRKYIDLAFLLVGLVVLALTYFIWSQYDRLVLIAPQPGLPGSEERKLFEKRVRKFFDRHEKEIEELREMILSEKRACAVGFARIGEYLWCSDTDTKKLWAFTKTLNSPWTYCPQEHALNDMMISPNRYAKYLDLLRKTGFRDVHKSLSSQNSELHFDRSIYARASDDPKYKQSLIATDKDKIYIWLDSWFPLVKPWYFMVYVPDNAPMPLHIEQHIKRNWYLTTCVTSY